jgi:hypothetical protein
VPGPVGVRARNTPCMPCILLRAGVCACVFACILLNPSRLLRDGHPSGPPHFISLFGTLRYTTSTCFQPLSLSPGVFATALAAGYYYHTCAIVTGGAVKCWGANNYGQLGIGSTAQQNSPADVILGSGGRDRSLARTVCAHSSGMGGPCGHGGE